MGLIAKLFWKLPEPFHTLLATVGNGWRVVKLEEGTFPNGRIVEDGGQSVKVVSDDDKPLRKITYTAKFRFEHWPGNQRPAKYTGRPW